MLETLLHKFYAASISIGTDGSMLVSSTRERVLIWGATFCIAASLSLIGWLIWRKHLLGRISLASFSITLLIPLLIIPSVRNEYIHASRDAITIESGKWYMPSRTVFKMRNIMNIRESDTRKLIPSNLIGDPNVLWHITRHDGNNEVVVLHEFFNAHRMVLAYYYIDRGYWLERLEDQQRLSM